MSPRIVITAPEFEKEARRLQRRFPGVAKQVRGLVLQLMDGNLPGDRVPRSSFQTFKVRLANPAASRGKRGGFRVYYTLYSADRIALVTIYSKTDTNDASLYEVEQRIRKIMDSITNRESHDD